MAANSQLIRSYFVWLSFLYLGISNVVGQVVQSEYPRASIDRQMSMLEVHFSEEDGVGYPILPGLLGLLLFEASPDFLELSLNQKEQVKAITETALDDALAAANSLIGMQSRDEIDKQLDRKLTEITDGIDTQIKQILLPHQIVALERYPMYLFVLRNGLFKTLAYSGLGKSIQVREDQRRQMEETADRLTKRINQLAVDLEKEIFEEFASILDQEQRESIDWLRPIYEKDFDLNLRNKLYHLDRANIGSCVGCDPSRAVLPISKDQKLKSVLDRK